MILSAKIQSELQTLKTYYKSLYYARWFLPTSIRQQMNMLEIADLTHSETVQKVFQLYAAMSSSSPFSKFILSWFSGFHIFQQSSLMQDMALFNKTNWLPQNFYVLMCSDCPKDSWSALQVLVSKSLIRGDKPTSHNINEANEEILEAITESKHPLDLAKAIIHLNDIPLFDRQILRTLKESNSPVTLALLISSFYDANKLTSYEMLPRLETHRKNLNSIHTYFAKDDIDCFDLDFCAFLVEIINEQFLMTSVHLSFVTNMYQKLQQNENLHLLMPILAVLNAKQIFAMPIGEAYCNFLLNLNPNLLASMTTILNMVTDDATIRFDAQEMNAIFNILNNFTTRIDLLIELINKDRVRNKNLKVSKDYLNRSLALLNFQANPHAFQPPSIPKKTTYNTSNVDPESGIPYESTDTVVVPQSPSAWERAESLLVSATEVVFTLFNSPSKGEKSKSMNGQSDVEEMQRLVLDSHV